ncbi:MAG: hypothetical protein NC403_09160 [Muribaculaceae bacterium]|nr:hypothetical protein [Muribaculaceae bacterium]
MREQETPTNYADPDTRAELQAYILEAISTIAIDSRLSTQQQMAVIEPLCEYARLINNLAIPG